MKHTILTNFFTALMVLLCISCAHQGNKMAAMDVVDTEDLAQETSSAPSEAAKQEKDLASLDAASEKEAVTVAKNDVPPTKKESLSENSDLSTLEEAAVAPVKEEAPKKVEAPEKKKVEESASKMDDKTAQDAVDAMLQMGEEEKSVALEEIKKMDVAPAPAVASNDVMMMIAQEDQVNADTTASEPESAVAPLPSSSHERELTNDSKSQDPAIETEPVPAPAKRSPKKQGSQNKAKKNRVEVVEYSKAKDSQKAVAPEVAKAPAVAKVEVAKEEKKDAKLASAEIADFMKEHYLLVGLVLVVGAFAAWRFSRRSAKPDDSFPV